MNLKKVWTAGVVVAAAGLTLTACGSNKDASGTKNLAEKQVLNWNEPSELPTMDPSKATDTISFDMMNNSMEGLYRIGKNSKIEPGIAKKTKVSKDGLTYTFTLRDDSKWSNGDPVVAKDFVYGWQRTLNPKTGSEYAYLYDGVKNANEVMEGKKPVDQLGIKAKGKHQLVVTLEKNVPYFKLLLGFPSFFPQNESVVKESGAKYGTASKYMAYNGPFKLNKWTGSNLSWSLDKNDKYWDKKAVKLDQINFKVNKDTSTGYNLYQAKKLDEALLSTEQANQLSKKPDYTVLKEARTNYLEFNQTQKKFQNKKIRQAISYAIDRDQLANKVLGSGTKVAKSVVSSGLQTYKGEDFADAAQTKAGVTFDKKKAKQLLKEGLKETGQDKLTFTLLGDDTDISKKVTAFIQSQLGENLGVDIRVSNVPFKTRLNRARTQQFDVVMGSWAADFSDAISFIDLFTSNNSYNNGKWKNAEYDKLVQASKTTDSTNDAKRWDDLVQASKILSEDQGVAPLYQLNQPTMVRENVKGLIQNSAGVSNNWKTTYIAK